MTQVRNAPRAKQLVPDSHINRGEIWADTISVAANYSTGRETVILTTAGAGGITITLQDITAMNEGKVYYVKKVDAGAGSVTVAADATDTIDGAASVILVGQYDSMGIVSDGVSMWHIIEPAGWGGYTPPANTCWLYCVATGTTYGGIDAAANITSPGADYNLALGWRAMRYNVTGDKNVVLGAEAGQGTVTKNYWSNVIIGYRAGFSLNYVSPSYNSSDNVLVGESAGYSLTGGNFNVYAGSSAGYFSTTAKQNVAIGNVAFEANQTGINNVAIGDGAGVGLGVGNADYDGSVFIGAGAGSAANSAAENCVAIGIDAGKGIRAEYNVYVGAGCGPAGASTGLNVGVGAYSLNAITTGTRNTTLGYVALGNWAQTCTDNVAAGYYAGRDHHGSYNVFVGSEAGEGAGAASTGSNNVMAGYQAGNAITSSSYSTGVGYQSLALLTTGTYNTALGWTAGDLLTTGAYNILIGQGADPTANNATYELNIGDTLYGDLSGKAIGINTPAPATMLELEIVETLTGNVADDYAAAITLDPGYTGAFTVTRHNYIDINRPSTAGGAAVTDAPVMRFDDTIANHESLDAAFQTTDSNGDTTDWALGLLINVNGVLYKLAAIAA